MGDFTGITRTIDHAVYMLLNALAIILWRLDAAVIQFSLVSYQTQDWLTGQSDGGIWVVLEKLIGANGLFGMNTWSAFFALALTIFGFTLLIRPFWRVQAVDVGRLFFFAVMSYTMITEGASLMRDVEAWRSEAGGYMYEILSASGGTVDLDIPGQPTSDEPIYNPEDLDGRQPIRAWEAVATSYFLVTDADELHDGVPPSNLRLEYCLYDPREPINDQDEENAEGCSPKVAWDEWDLITTQPITEVWGIPLPIDVSITLPIVDEHPEDRQLAIRQAQEGVARLALGPIVALFPMIEANVSLMLALSASFIYLSLPLTLLFAFFMYTEPLTTRLFFQLINVFIRTIILNGLIAVFLMLLMAVTVNGSLTAYLGLIGVGIIGGFFLGSMATGTMKETLSQSLGAVGGIWVRGATDAFGEGARKPAQSMMGVAKWAAGGAGAGVVMSSGGGIGRAAEMFEVGRGLFRSGSQDIAQGSPEVARALDTRISTATSQLPEPLARIARAGASDLSAPTPESAPQEVRSAVSAPAAGRPLDVIPAGVRSGGDLSRGFTPVDRFNPFAPLSGSASQSGEPPRSSAWAAGTYIGDGKAIESWADQVYGTGETGQRQLGESARDLLGENLGQETHRVMSRRTRDETMAVMRASRQVVSEKGVDRLLQPDGSINPEGLRLVQKNLDDQTAGAFSGLQGDRDMAVLAAASLQPQKRAQPEEFREAAASAQRWTGDQAAGREVPRSLGLDPVAAGSHFAALNRFTRLSEQAGLEPEKRQELLRVAKLGTEIPGNLRDELAASLQKQQEQGFGIGLKVNDLVESARSLPDTLEGPMLVRLPHKKLDLVPEVTPSLARMGTPDDKATGLVGDVPSGTVETGLRREFRNEVRAARASDGEIGTRLQAGRNGKGMAGTGQADQVKDETGARVTNDPDLVRESRTKGKASRPQPEVPDRWSTLFLDEEEPLGAAAQILTAPQKKSDIDGSSSSNQEGIEKMPPLPNRARSSGSQETSSSNKDAKSAKRRKS